MAVLRDPQQGKSLSTFLALAPLLAPVSSAVVSQMPGLALTPGLCYPISPGQLPSEADMGSGSPRDHTWTPRVAAQTEVSEDGS